MNCNLPGPSPIEGGSYPYVDFTWFLQPPGRLYVSWTPLSSHLEVYIYLVTLTSSFCINPNSDSNGTISEDDLKVISSEAKEYKFGVDSKSETVQVVLSDLRACTYDLCVAPLTNPRLSHCPGGTKTLVIEPSVDVNAEPESWVSYFDGDSFIILMAFVFWAILISTFFKEWGAIKNLQPREISRQTTPYPCNVSEVKVIQRERESVINYRNPDSYQSRIAKFTKMRQFRHAAPGGKTSPPNSPTMGNIGDSCSSGLQSKQPTIEIEFAKPDIENQLEESA